jgi:2-oxoglutarate dehydrogenase E2 component (dihydrolipoamide succinyltransferase)
MVELKVPAVGESISEVFIGTWLKQEGEAVAKDEAVVEVETDKATLEIPAPEAGVLAKLLKAEGEGASVGEVIAHIETEAVESEPAPKPEGDEGAQLQEQAAARAEPTDEPAPEKAHTGDQEARTEGFVMPAAQRLLDEHGLSEKDVSGTGPGGRILKEDVQRVLEARAQKGAERPAAKAPEKPAETPAEKPAEKPAAKVPQPTGERREEAVRMTPLRRTIARRLVEAQQTAALLTTFNEVDMSAVMELRSTYRDAFEKEHGVRLGFMSFFVRSAIDALARVPQLNAEIRGDQIVYKDYYDIAVAVSTERGLVTPVIRNAERLGFADIEKVIGDFGKRAQTGKLTPDELSGGTFTISNGGVFGSLMSTPIVNPPQSGVLGMHAIQERPVARDGAVVIRPMMYLALTYDHRIVDGREAVTFLRRIKDGVENPTRLLLEV